MMHHEALSRLLRAAGLVRVAGWVWAKDAPAIRRKIEAAKDEADRVKREAEDGQ